MDDIKTSSPNFWFEGNLWFGHINSMEKLQEMLDAYAPHRTLDDDHVVDVAFVVPGKDDKMDYITPRALEHSHLKREEKISLRQYLKERGIEIV